MKSYILNLNFLQLKKLEVQTLANRVLVIVEKHDPEVLKIKEIFDILVEQKPQIKLLKVRYGPHPVTIDLNILRKRRNALMKGIIDRLKSIEDGKMGGKEEAIKVAKPVVIRYLQGLSRQSEETITGTVIQFFEFVAENQNVQTAISTLELTTDLDDLKSVNKEIDEQYDYRTENLSQRPKMNTRNIVSALKSDIQDVFKQIEVAQIKNQDLDYNPLIDELNEEIAHYKAIIKARASYNKKKAEEALNGNKVVEDNGVFIEGKSGKPSESTQSTERMYPMNVEAGNGEVSDHLDIKKVVAVPTKQTRLPNVSTEA